MEKMVVNRMEISKITGLSPWAVWRLTKEGKLPHLKIGGKYMYRLESIKAWMDTQEKESVATEANKEYGILRKIKTK